MQSEVNFDDSLEGDDPKGQQRQSGVVRKVESLTSQSRKARSFSQQHEGKRGKRFELSAEAKSLTGSDEAPGADVQGGADARSTSITEGSKEGGRTFRERAKGKMNRFVLFGPFFLSLYHAV